MPREPNPKIEQGKMLFEQGKKLIEIAEQLEVPEGTVRSWKNRYKWDSEDNVTLQKVKRNVAKGKSPPTSKKQTKLLAEVEQVIDNPGLTDKQRLFCLYYIKSFNATKAYQKAYGVDYATAASIAYRLMEKDGIVKEIKRLKQSKLNQVMLSPEDIFQKYMDIAFSDVTDYLMFGRKEIVVNTDGDGNEITAEVNYVDFKDSSQVDGTLISEVKQGKDGVSIKLADRMKALQWLAEHMDLATEEQRLKIAKLNKELGESNREPIKIEFIRASQRGEEDE